jgi:hypothetical protein
MMLLRPPALVRFLQQFVFEGLVWPFFVAMGQVLGTQGIHDPGVWFHALGAVCGGLQGGIGAALNEGDFGDVMLGAGLGAAFGAAVPWGGIGSLAGAAAGYGIAKWAFGNDDKALAQGWELGGLVGGIAGSARQATLAAAKNGAARPLLSGLLSAGPDLLGGGAGAIYGWCQDGTSTTALRWAQVGMMGAALTGAAARGLWGVTRAKGPLSSGRTISAADAFSGLGQRQPLSSLNKRQMAVHAALNESGATAWFVKRQVSMADLRAVGRATGDEYAMFTLGRRRFVIRGFGNEIRVTDDLAIDLLAAKYGRWSGHTHPPGYLVEPSIIDRAFLPEGQVRSAVWGDGDIGYTIFHRTPLEDQMFNMELRSQLWRRFYEGR